MNPTLYDITSLVPAADWQAEQLRTTNDPHASDLVRNTAKTKICTAFEAYVCYLARSWWRRFRQLHGKAGYDDIASAGRQGLLTALDRWKPDYEKPFIHFASRWINESCRTEAIRLSQGCCELPRKVRRLCVAYRGLRQSGSADDRAALLRNSHSRQSTKQIVRYFGQSDTDRGISLDFSPSPDRGLDPAIRTLKAEQNSPAESAELSEQLATIRAVLMSKCRPRERLIFFIHYPHVPLSLVEVGQVLDKAGNLIDLSGLEAGQTDGRLRTIAGLLGISRERVRQLWVEILAKLRISFQAQAHSVKTNRGEHQRTVAA